LTSTVSAISSLCSKLCIQVCSFKIFNRIERRHGFVESLVAEAGRVKGRTTELIDSNSELIYLIIGVAVLKHLPPDLP
jgi:prenyltransferase beta subunit